MSDTVETVTLTEANLKEVASRTTYSIRELALKLRWAKENERTVVILLTPLKELWRDNHEYQGAHRDDHRSD
jgi:hypothetical protein